VNEDDLVPESTSGGIDRATLLRTMALGGGALSIPALLSACGSSSNAASSGASGGGPFATHPKWKFVFINHATTNAFFVPTQYGAADASSLLGVSYQWTGSPSSDVGTMVNDMSAAVAGKADGLAVAIIDPNAFNAPVAAALAAGIPVVSYNADAPASAGNTRMAYIGQDLFQAGVQMGNRIVEEVGSGEVVIFIITPGSLNLQPRVDGAISAIKASGKPITVTQTATSTDPTQELSIIDAYYLGHKTVKGMYGSGGTTTQSIGTVIKKYNQKGKVQGGGFDLIPQTLQYIDEGLLSFTIDQQPYLQGFYPVMQLFLYKLSGGLMFPSETNTGLLFVTKDNVKPYLTTKTRWEGSATAQKYPITA
jgi:simple sugar transport system substrate-binding protein